MLFVAQAEHNYFLIMQIWAILLMVMCQMKLDGTEFNFNSQAFHMYHIYCNIT